MLNLKRLFSKKGGAAQSTVVYMLSAAAVMSSMTFPGASHSYTAAMTDNSPEYTVTITADGVNNVVTAGDMAVGELLVREHYSLGAYDELNVSTDAPVCDDMKIKITRVDYIFREKSEFIAYDTERTASAGIKAGESRIVTEGVDGSITITIQDKYVDGVKLSSEVTDTDIVEPVTEVIEYGTALAVPVTEVIEYETALAEPISSREGEYTLENGIPAEYEYVLDGKVTAYTAPGGSGTYSGRPLVVGSVAVDPDIIPFGSELYIVSKDGTHVYGYAIASDTGDLTEAGVLADAYMGTTEEHYADACDWGAQYCYVYVLSVGDNSVSWR